MTHKDSRRWGMLLVRVECGKPQEFSAWLEVDANE